MYVCFKMAVLQHNKYILTFVRKKVAKSSVYKKGQKLVSRLKYVLYCIHLFLSK